jgi:uncharacterized protein HemY
MGSFGRRGAAVAVAVALGSSVLVGVSGTASAAQQHVAGVSAVVPAASSGDFLDAVEQVMPSLRHKYTDARLVKIAKSMCTSLKAGATFKQVDVVLRKHMSKDQALVLASLGSAAFCPSYYEKARKYYHIPA